MIGEGSKLLMRSPLKYFMPSLLLVSGIAGFSQRANLYLEASSASLTNPTSTPEQRLLLQPTYNLLVTDLPTPSSTQPLPTATLETSPGYAVGPTDFPYGINPLTGLPIEKPAWLERRPIAVKITNFPRSVRPQWGLNFADQVVEVYIGDDMTRFIAIYYGNQAKRVGPVRSGRLVDAQIMRMYKAFLVFGYADPKVRDVLFEDDLNPFLIFETPSNCPPLCRLDNGLAYNNLFADTLGLEDYFDRKHKNNDRQYLDGLRFDSEPAASEQAGIHLEIHYTYVSYHRWEYDPFLGRYLRFQEVENDHGQELIYEPLLDALDEKQVSADNLVVLFAPHETYYRSSSTWIVDIPLKKHGDGFAFRDGRAYPITWTRTSKDQLLRLNFPSGEIYPLKPGNTWFEIIGSSSQFTLAQDGAWHFEFQIP